MRINIPEDRLQPIEVRRIKEGVATIGEARGVADLFDELSMPSRATSASCSPASGDAAYVPRSKLPTVIARAVMKCRGGTGHRRVLHDPRGRRSPPLVCVPRGRQPQAGCWLRGDAKRQRLY